MSVVDDALDYQKYNFTHGTYQMTRIIQQTGGQTDTITTTGGQESIFEIPPKVWNAYRSEIRFTLTPAAGPVNQYNWLFTDGFSAIRQLQLYTRSGLYLLDVNDLDRYTNMTLRRETRLDDMLTYDKVDGVFSGLAEINDSGSAASIAPATATNCRNDFTIIKTAYLEPSYNFNGIVAANATPVLNVSLNLNRLKNTLFENDKDLYFNGEILYLRIVWAPSTKILFTAGSNAPSRIAAPAPNVSSVVYSNLVMYMAVEVNPEIENMIKAKCLSAEGLQILTDYVYYNKLNLGPSLIQNTTTRYNRAHGIKLKKIYWAPYNNVETSNTAFDHSNLAAAKVVSFYTMINNIRTTQYDFTQANSDDYIVKQNSLRGSCILSSNEYYYNWVWVEDFTDDNPVWKQFSVPKENCIDGLDLTNEIKYDIYSNTAVGGGGGVQLNHYIYAVTQKLLTISPAGITLQ